MQCLPNVGCSPIPCTLTGFNGGSGKCSGIKNRFRIIRPGDTRIGDSDKVLLRSIYKPTMWLNCTGTNKECTISECTNNAADSNSSSYISDCEDHFFIIKGRKRSPGKVLSIRHAIGFKSYKDNTYLNCLEKKCRMVEPPGTCSPNKDEGCIQSFNITKTSEI